MTFLQMRCFLNLARSQKMSATAALMDLNLSTLSKFIGRMEDELGVKLFSKDQQRLTLTREGKLIFPCIVYIVKLYNEQRSEIYRYAPEDRPTLSIAVAFTQEQIIKCLIAFSREETSARLRVMEASTNDICAMLDTGNADVGILHEQLVKKKYPHTLPIRTDELVAIVSEKHALANQGTISVSQLKDETFYFFKGDHLLHQYQLRACISAGFVPKEDQSDIRMSTILNYIASGNGVSLLTLNAVNVLAVRRVAVLRLREEHSLKLCAFSASSYVPRYVRSLMSFISKYRFL